MGRTAAAAAAASATKRWVSGWRGRALGEEDEGEEDGPIIIPLTGAPDRGGEGRERGTGFLGGSFGKEGGLTIGGGGIGGGGSPPRTFLSFSTDITIEIYHKGRKRGGA